MGTLIVQIDLYLIYLSTEKKGMFLSLKKGTLSLMLLLIVLCILALGKERRT